MNLTVDEWNLVIGAGGVMLLGVIVGLMLYGMTHNRKPAAPGSSGWLERIKNEPALVSALIGYVVLVAGHYGLDLPTEFEAAAALVVFVLTGASVRQQVTPTRKLS